MVLKEHFDTAPKNATNRSKTIQNDIISCSANILNSKIISELRHSKYFSILADCVCSKKMPLVIRYAHRENNIQERFLKFIHCDQGVTGKALTDRIFECLVNEFNLDIQNCCGHFSISADEVSVCSKKEQLPLVIRYAHWENNIQ